MVVNWKRSFLSSGRVIFMSGGEESSSIDNGKSEAKSVMTMFEHESH